MDPECLRSEGLRSSGCVCCPMQLGASGARVLLEGLSIHSRPQTSREPHQASLQGQLSVVFVRSFLGVAELVWGLRLDCRVKHVSTDIFIFICMVRFV